MDWDGITIGDVATVARTLYALAGETRSRVREVYLRADRIVSDFTDGGAFDDSLFEVDAERAVTAVLAAKPVGAVDFEQRMTWTASLAAPLETFFVDVLVMSPDERLKTNRLRLLRTVRDEIRSSMGDLSQLSG